MSNLLVVNSYRGHAIYESSPHEWRYVDTDEWVHSHPKRSCGHCGMPNRSDGHDACLGHLPGVANACCGHGDQRTAYIQVETVD